MFQRYLAALSQRQEEAQFRSPRTYTPIDATHVIYHGSTYLMMASNNYLGLTHHPHVQARAKHAVDTYGTGNTENQGGNDFLQDVQDKAKEIVDQAKNAIEEADIPGKAKNAWDTVKSWFGW